MILFLKGKKYITGGGIDYCVITVVQIQPRKDVLDHAGYTPSTRQHDLDPAYCISGVLCICPACPAYQESCVFALPVLRIRSPLYQVFALPVLRIRSLVYLPCLSDIDNELEIDDLSHV